MARALELAAHGRWTTRPNPMVGCILVRDGQVVGEGYHVIAGGPHAEIHALASAQERAQGSTAYVTLEPCAHFGSTPPCAQALIQAGVARVIAAMQDPFPKVNGGGFAQLIEAGISVASGLLEHQARELNCGYLSRVQRQRPWVRLKLGASLDGRTALANGVSKWITSSASRQDVQLWRARASAILTGVGTVLADDPELTVRLSEPLLRPPLRVVLDTQLRSLMKQRIRNQAAPTLYLHAPESFPPADFQGCACCPIPRHQSGGLDLEHVLNYLAQQGVNELMIEAGATLSGAFVQADLVDEFLLYLAPVLLGCQARPLLANLGIHQMSERIQLDLSDVCQLDGDIRLILRRRSSQGAKASK